MRKQYFKKITAAVMSLTMVVGMSNVVLAAHAANGANVATDTRWESYSILTMEDHVDTEDGSVKNPWCWYHSLTHLQTEDFPNGQVPKYDFATEGWTIEMSPSSSTLWVANTGWDGQYGPNGLVGDNPWGLWLSATNVPIELGRTYTVSFKIKSTLKGTVSVKDETGKATGETETVYTKHILYKAYDPVSKGEPGVSFDSISSDKLTEDGDDRVSPDGTMILDSRDDWMTVTTIITIPPTKKSYASDYVGFKFACGAFLMTYPDELAMKGEIMIKDFEVVAGTQHTVTYTNGSTSSQVYVNDGSSVSYVDMPKKGYVQTGFTLNGNAYTFGTPVTSDITLMAAYKATPKPAAPKFTAKSGAKKKVTVTIASTTNAKGYEIQYSAKKNMKGARKVTTTAAKYTIKKLKSKKFTYIKVRGYNLDSTGAKVYGSLSKVKRVYVK